MKLWLKILIGLTLGVVVGIIFGPKAAVLKPIGTIFLNLITMIIPLLVLSSMTVGITSIHDPKKLGRVGLTTLSLYVITTVIAICIGLSIIYLFKPGEGLGLEYDRSTERTGSLHITEILLSIFPTNPIQSLAEGNVLQIITFSVFLGIAIIFTGKKGQALLSVLESLSDVMYRLTGIVMQFSPYGVFAIMAWVSGTFGITILIPLLKFLCTYYIACALHVGIVFCGILWFLAKLHPLPFFKGMRDAIMVAFTTCSSSATLPVSMACVQRNLGVSKSISSFVMPLGSTLNMNGTAIFQAMSAVFIAAGYGISLDSKHLLTIVLTSTLSAIGAAGIPGSGFIMLSAVLTSAGLPLEGLAIIAGIDRLREMVSTVLNVLGDAICAVYVARLEGELDEKQYNAADEPLNLEESS
jgi:Na+/H+-dicarboxylate symporter